MTPPAPQPPAPVTPPVAQPVAQQPVSPPATQPTQRETSCRAIRTLDTLEIQLDDQIKSEKSERIPDMASVDQICGENSFFHDISILDQGSTQVPESLSGVINSLPKNFSLRELEESFRSKSIRGYLDAGFAGVPLNEKEEEQKEGLQAKSGRTECERLSLAIQAQRLSLKVADRIYSHAVEQFHESAEDTAHSNPFAGIFGSATLDDRCSEAGMRTLRDDGLVKAQQRLLDLYAEYESKSSR